MSTIVILGAAGRIGDAAARAFVEAGWTVKGVARGARAGTLAAGVEPVIANAYDRDSLIEACRGADVVLNALNPQYTEWETTVLPMARNVLAAVEATGALHMLVGNVYNFGYSIAPRTREDAAQVASTPKARIRIDMENLFRQAAEERGVRTVVLRAGDFYGGERRESWLDLIILKRLQSDIFTWGGPMEIPHAFAYLPDLGRAFVALAERRQKLAPFDLFHFEGHTLTGHQMKAAAEAAAGRPLSARKMPWLLLRAAGIVSPMLREISVMSYLWRTPHSLDGAKLEAFAGPLSITPPVAALRQAIADLGLDGQRPALAA